MSRLVFGFGLAAIVGLAVVAQAANEVPKGLDQTGKPDLKSAGPLAFGPKGVLFVADPQGAAVFALAVGEAPKAAIGGDFKLAGVDSKVAALLGTTAADILINDVAVEPGTGIAYLSVSRGRGPDAEPAIARVDGARPGDGPGSRQDAVCEDLDRQRPLGRGQGQARQQPAAAIRSPTWPSSMARLFIAGLSNEEFASKLRSIEFPFKSADTSTSVEIYHGAHGAFETRSPVRTFVPFRSAASRTCWRPIPARRSSRSRSAA